MNAARDTDGTRAISAADSLAGNTGTEATQSATQSATQPDLGGEANLRTRFAMFAAIAIVGYAADWLTKFWVFRWPRGPGRYGEWWLVEDFCGVQHSWNRGAIWGMGQGYSFVFAGISVLAGLGIVFWLIRGGAIRDRWLLVALGCVLGGICGNLYDRLGLWGDLTVTGEKVYAVRDWILFRFRGWTWPNFNIADCLLVVGSALLAWHAAIAPSGSSSELVKSTQDATR